MVVLLKTAQHLKALRNLSSLPCGDYALVKSSFGWPPKAMTRSQNTWKPYPQAVSLHVARAALHCLYAENVGSRSAPTYRHTDFRNVREICDDVRCYPASWT